MLKKDGGGDTEGMNMIDHFSPYDYDIIGLNHIHKKEFCTKLNYAHCIFFLAQMQFHEL